MDTGTGGLAIRTHIELCAESASTLPPRRLRAPSVRPSPRSTCQHPERVQAVVRRSVEELASLFDGEWRLLLLMLGLRRSEVCGLR